MAFTRPHACRRKTCARRTVYVAASIRLAGPVLLILSSGPVQAGESDASPPPAARLSVDSTFPGYGSAVLTDGRWLAKGQENPREFGPDRLGNAGNTWVSAEGPGEHWARLDWPEPVTLNELEICWSLQDWWPRAFRIEALQAEQWIPAAGEPGWLAVTDRQSIVPLQAIPTRSIRIIQPLNGGGDRALMALQELIPRHTAPPRALSGARPVSAAEFRRITRTPFTRNLARLDADCPGASQAMIWSPAGTSDPLPAVADGDEKNAAAELLPGAAAGVEWPVAHVIDGAAVVMQGDPPDAARLAVELFDGRGWVPITRGLKLQALPDRRRVEWSFEPVATRSIRVRLREGDAAVIAEMEACRYLPEGKNAWPERFVARGVVQREVLSAGEEPSFERLATQTLSMRTSRALLGLKDTPREVGAAWDGTLHGRHRIGFRFGPERHRLADFAETVRRELIDGWRPGVVVDGRADTLQVRQVAFVAPWPGQPAGVLVVQVTVRNLTQAPLKTWIEADVHSDAPEPVTFTDGLLTQAGKVALLSPQPACAGESPGTLRVDLELAPGEAGNVVFLEPQESIGPGPTLETLRTLDFDRARAEFGQYWDDILKNTSATFELPEARINRMVRAVLAQCFINGDGDVMPYGSVPSVYEASLFGIEESYPMLGLALFGYGDDARRYLDGTYLTRDFLRKVESYTSGDDRHQQYRNGLQPHYAISAYRLGRDEAWIRRHLPLIRECAEWTIAERRKTMTPEEGPRPLHWGLLPAWAYGGDIAEVKCHALYANLCCWRGLVDTAWLLAELGDRDAARRCAEEARDYRAAIDRAIDGSYQAGARPPFLPLRLYADKPDEQLDYYQLFAGCLLDIEPFAPGSRHQRWIADYLEADNRVFCLLPRFRHIGPGALDAIYGKGYILSKLHEDAIPEFLLGFYAYLAFNMERDVFTSRESNVLYSSDLQGLAAFPAADITDPLPCASAVALHFVRHMLVTEERDGAGGYSGNLLLLAGTPRAWYADDATIRLRRVPTYFGPVDVEVNSHASRDRIEARVQGPARQPVAKLRLRLRHPAGKPLQRVTLDGRRHDRFDPRKEWIELPGGTAGPQQIVAEY